MEDVSAFAASAGRLAQRLHIAEAAVAFLVFPMEFTALEECTSFVQAGKALLFSNIAVTGVSAWEHSTACLFGLGRALLRVADVVKALYARLAHVALGQDTTAVPALPR